MKTPSDNYWLRRSLERAKAYHKAADETVLTVTRAYDKAINDITRKTQEMFERLSRSGDLSPAEASKLLSQTIGRSEWEAIKAQISAVKDPSLKRELLTRLNAPSYSAGITRLEALKADIYIKSKLIADIELGATTRGYIETIDSAYYRTVFDIQQGLGIGFDFSSMPTSTIEAILKNPWSGKHFSSRVWHNTDLLAKRMTEVITAGLMSGAGIHKMSTELEELSALGKHAANRLVRTETTYMANAAEMESYREVGIDKYIFLATLDTRTSPQCREADLKVFQVPGVAGENLPPLHPYCRSTTRAYFGPETLTGIQRRARDPITGRNNLVSGDMTYKEWRKSMDAKHGKERIDTIERQIKNKSSDKAQYERYKERLGPDAPKSFTAFQDLKYNDANKWEETQLFYGQKGSGWIPDSMSLKVWADNMRGVNWQAVDFAPKKFLGHYEKHRLEFGLVTKEEYVTMARELLNSSPGGTIAGFTSSQGSVFRYNTSTNSFGIAKPDGVISTFFKPKDGQEYWEEQRRKYERQ